MSIFKCPNCHDEQLPEAEVPCWKCGARRGWEGRKTRFEILRGAQRTIDEIEQIFIDCEHWNRLHPNEVPIDCDPDGKMRLMSDAMKDMIARDRAKGHVGSIDAPLMALVIQKGPSEAQ